ncbi:MAG TPA: hypothetical protein VE620_12965 [Myxococcales bacterium]|jgi:hypothetical protein|nr:hypothetical protein [Myxococcales bacterium]
MRPLAIALLLCAACGSSTPALYDGCRIPTPTGTFTFHAQQELPACGFPATFDLSLTVNATSASGVEAGVAFTAYAYSSCQLAWNDATTLHVIQVDSRTETLVRNDGCTVVYKLTP